MSLLHKMGPYHLPGPSDAPDINVPIIHIIMGFTVYNCKIKHKHRIYHMQVNYVLFIQRTLVHPIYSPSQFQAMNFFTAFTFACTVYILRCVLNQAHDNIALYNEHTMLSLLYT